MNVRRYLVYRLLWTTSGVWTILTGLFAFFVVAPDPHQIKRYPGGRQIYRSARNYDQPLLDRYARWLERFVTLDFGTTVGGEPITPMLVDATSVTLTYLVPSVAVAVGLGICVGVLRAMDRDSVVLRVVRGASYGGFAVPTFVLASATSIVATEHLGVFDLAYSSELSLFSVRNLRALVLPAAVVTVNLLAVQLRYARSESIEILQEDFVRTLRSNGAGTRTLVAHVLRNAAPSLLSVFFSELVGVLFVVVVIVEVIFGVPGFGLLLYQSIQQRDVGLILATTVLPILLILLGNLLQDLAYAVLDPRMGHD